MNNFYLIGLIGTIGSGKSTVRKMLEDLGARGIDADQLTHVVMRRGSPTWHAIVDTFGADMLTWHGRIDRRKLGKRVFEDEAALRKLESIVHPAVREEIKNLMHNAAESIIVIEAIKLVEGGLYQWCDALWAITASPHVQLERVMQTRNLSAQDAQARLDAQGSFEEKLRLANVVIDNSGDEQNTRRQVRQAWDAIRVETARDKSQWLTGAPHLEIPTPVVAPIEQTLTQTTVVPEILVTPPPAPTYPPLTAQTPIQVRRSRRSDLDSLRVAIAKSEGRAEPLAPDEALKRFGERGYRIAIADSRIIALVAWEAENLVAMVREIWAESPEAAALALPKLVNLIEDEGRGLVCEVVLLFVDATAPLFVIDQIRAAGYQPQELAALHKMWRQVAEERLHLGDRIWSKRLREEMVTRPI